LTTNVPKGQRKIKME